MEFYADEILAGLDKIPTPNHPGKITISGASQCVLAYKSPENISIAAHCVEKGRVIVMCHDNYFEWISNPENNVKQQFCANVIKWLIGEELPPSEIFSFQQVDSSDAIDSVRLIKWHQDFDPSEETEEALLEWLKNGGFSNL